MRPSAVAALLICGVVASCATYVTPAPNLVAVPIEVNGVRLLNETPEAEPRKYFSDGITTYKTDYRGWTQVVINAYGVALSNWKSTSSTPKSLGFSIQGINCSGHYIADCSLSLLVTRSDGVRKIYNTATFNGYPIASALQQALDAAANLAAADTALEQFLRQ